MYIQIRGNAQYENISCIFHFLLCNNIQYVLPIANTVILSASKRKIIEDILF